MTNIEIPYNQEYKNLANARHSTRIANDLSIWPDLVPDDVYQIKSNDFWILNDLLDTLHIEYKQKYLSPITLGGALIDNTPQELVPENPRDKNKLVNQHIYVPTEKSNTELSQYACWTLIKSMNQDSTFFQEYFMNPDMELIPLYRTAFNSSRIPLRAKLSKLNSQLNGIFASVGANHSSQFATYNREKTETLFGGKTKVNIIKNRHLLPNVNTPKNNTFAKPTSTHLPDYMNAWLLGAYIKAIQNIILQWDETSRLYRNYPTLRDITHNEMKRARNGFITKYESSPEENISSYGIKTIEHDLRLREIEFAKKHIASHVR